MVMRFHFDNQGPWQDMMWLAGSCLDPACAGSRRHVPLVWQTSMPDTLRCANVVDGPQGRRRLICTMRPPLDNAAPHTRDTFHRRCTKYLEMLTALGAT